METSREDVGIAIRSAFLQTGTKQRFSLLALILFSIILIYVESIEYKPLNYLRSFIKDTIYAGSVIISYPTKALQNTLVTVKEHLNLFDKNIELKQENTRLKNEIYDKEYILVPIAFININI